MRPRPLRSLLTWCSLLLLVSCLGRGSPRLASTEPPPRRPVTTTATAGEEGRGSVPATLRMALLQTQQKAAGHDFARDTAGTLHARVGGYGATADVTATPRGVHVSRADMDLGIHTASVGREGAAGSRQVWSRRAEGQELVLEREDDVEERYLAGPLGLEQSFGVRTRPDGQGPLRIEVAFDGLAPEAVEGASDRVLLRDRAGRARGGYRDLVAADAEGRNLPARMEVRGGGVALVIDDAGARYPLRVDPLAWAQEAEITASDGATRDGFGYSVSVSGDTAVVGAYSRQIGANAWQGAAYVFVQSGGSWIQEAELTAADGAANDFFGASVSVSGDTILVGAYWHQVGANMKQGAAYVFVRSGTSWVQQAELIAADGAAGDELGGSVSLSGSTAVVGAIWHQVGANMNQGAAYVFVQSGTSWAQQAELTAPDGAAGDYFGAVSVNGGTAVVGASGHQVGANAQQGAAYVFVQSGASWTQQAQLTAADGAARNAFGGSVSVSGDTVLVGAAGYQIDVLPGSAYVFARSGTSWIQAAKLTGDAAILEDFGFSVSVSGGVAIVGAPENQAYGQVDGSVYVFVLSGNSWVWQANLTSVDDTELDELGWAVAVSGGTVIAGAWAHQVGANDLQGAAYVMVPVLADGAACTSGAGCQSTYCVDAVCCDAPCGGGVTLGCQACSVATGAGADGTCTALTGTACDDGNACTTGDTCQSGTCTAGSPAGDGTGCPGGTCQGGTCTPDGGTGGGGSSTGTGGATTTSTGTGGATTTSTGTGGATTSTGATTASTGTGGAAATGTDTGPADRSTEGGCGCRIAGEPAPGGRWILAMPLAIGLGTGLRRRRRRLPSSW